MIEKKKIIEQSFNVYELLDPPKPLPKPAKKVKRPASDSSDSDEEDTYEQDVCYIARSQPQVESKKSKKKAIPSPVDAHQLEQSVASELFVSKKAQESTKPKQCGATKSVSKVPVQTEADMEADMDVDMDMEADMNVDMDMDVKKPKSTRKKTPYTKAKNALKATHKETSIYLGLIKSKLAPANHGFQDQLNRSIDILNRAENHTREIGLQRLTRFIRVRL